MPKAELFPGMLEVLKTLKANNYKIALATYKLMRCVTKLFDYKDVSKYFDTMRGSEEKNYSKFIAMCDKPEDILKYV